MCLVPVELPEWMRNDGKHEPGSVHVSDRCATAPLSELSPHPNPLDIAPPPLPPLPNPSYHHPTVSQTVTMSSGLAV